MVAVSSSPVDEPAPPSSTPPPERHGAAGVPASVFPAAEPGEATQPGPHVFISHAGEQKMTVVDVIRARLKERYPQLDVFTDEWSLKGGDRALPRIAAACRGATVAVVVLSKEFVRKEYPMAELRILMDRWHGGQQQQGLHSHPAGQQQQGLHSHPAGQQQHATDLEQELQSARDHQPRQVWVVPVLYGLTVEEVRGMRARYNSQPWCVKDDKPDAAVLDQWAADLRALACLTMIRPDQWRMLTELAALVEEGVVKQLQAAGRFPKPPAPCLEVRNCVPRSKVVQLVGRQQELQQAFKALTEGRYVEVVGGPGEGKTSLVQRLVERWCERWRLQPASEHGGRVAHALEVDLRFEGLQAEGVKQGYDLRNDVATKLLVQVREPADKQQWLALQAWIQAQNSTPVLVVFENAEDCIMLPSEMGPISVVFQKKMLDVLSSLENVYLVVASRVRTPDPLRASSVVVLQQLSPADGLQLLEGCLPSGYQWSADGKEQRAAGQLVQLVQSNPLTLTVAAGLVARGRHTWEDVLRCAQQGIATIKPRSRMDPNAMTGYMAALQGWLSTFLEEEERQLLSRVCVFAGSFTDPGAAAVSPGVAADDLADTLQLLVDTSLLRQHVVTSGGGDVLQGQAVERYTMHALVRDAASRVSDCAARDEVVVQCFARWMLLDSEGPGQMLLRCEPEGDDPDTMRCLYILHEELVNLDAASEGLAKAADRAAAVALLDAAGQVGRVLSDYGHGYAAKRLHETAAQVAVSVLGAEDPATLMAKNRQAKTYSDMGELGEARRLHMEVLKVRTKVLGPEHDDTLASKNNLGLTLIALGEHGEARQLQEDVLKACTLVLGPEHPYTVSSKNNLALSLHYLGELGGARRLEEEVLEVHTRMLGPEHPDTLGSKNNLASTLSDMGELGEARRLHEELLPVYTRVLGPEHPSTLTSKNNLAMSMSDMGEHGDARRLQEELLEVLTRVLGPAHHHTLTSKMNLTTTLSAMGEVREARRLREEVLEMRMHVLGLEHPNTLSCMSNLALSMRDMGEHREARKLHEKVLEVYTWVLGPEHPDTLGSKKNLAMSLNDIGELREARRLEEEVLEVQMRVLGPEHCFTLTTKSNLSMSMRDMGELREARQLLEEVLEVHVRVLGPKHPDTLRSKNNLATCMSDMGDLGQAKQLQEEVLDVHTQIRGPDHPIALTAKNNLALSLRAMGDVREARQLLVEVVHVRTQVLGSEHPDTLMSKNNLATCMSDMGEPGEARRLQNEVLEEHMRVLGSEHPNTLLCKNNLANSMRAMGDLEDARRLHEEVLEEHMRVLGPEHPNTLLCKNNLANSMRGMGDLEDARRLQEEVLEMRAKVLGPEHPVTLQSKRELAAVQ